MSIQRQLIRGNTTQVEAATLLPAQYAFDTTKNEATVGNGSVAGGIRLAKKNNFEPLSPAQITADTNDYNPSGLKHAGRLIVTTDASRNLTGLVAAGVIDTLDGREIEIYNGGSNNLVLKDQNAGSSAANRFDLGGADLTLASKNSATLRYSVSISRWQMVAQTAGSAVSSGGVIARTLAGSSQGFCMVNGTLVPSVGSGALTIGIKTLAGNDPSSSDPVLVKFRDAALATGDYVVMTLTAATSLVISSGSSMGATNGVAFALRLIGINDAGTFRLGAINVGRGGAAIPLLNPDQLISSTAEGGAGNADNANTIYTGTAVASKPFAMLATLDWSSGLTTAGTWDAVPTTIQLFGQGDALPGHGGAVAVAKRICGMTGGTIVESHSGNAATFAVKTLAGNDPSANEPVIFTFQNASGGYSVRTVTAALSVTVPSSQALGTSNGVAFRLWLVAIDTGSTAVLGIVNCLSGSSILALLEGVAYSSTAIATAPSAQVIYSTSAQASKQIAPIAYADYDSGMATAGTWNASPTRMVLFTPGTPRPGEPTGNVAFSSTGALATGTTSIPFDDTIPQSTEGDQYFSQAITPLAAQNILEVESALMGGASGTSALGHALFRDAGANAIAASFLNPSASGFGFQSRVLTRVLAGSASSTTFKVRAGCSTSLTFTLNGLGGARDFAGVMSSYLKISELMG